jgi:Zn-dependent protease
MSGLLLGRVRGIEVRIHWSVAVIAWLLTWSLASNVFPSLSPGSTEVEHWTAAGFTAVGFLGGLFAHEMGHSVVAQRNGVDVRSITLWLFGGIAQLGAEPTDPGAALRIAAAGPAVSVGLAVTGLALRVVAGDTLTGAALLWFGSMSMVLALFNLLPAFPLDGGRIYQAWIWRRTGDRGAATRRAAGAGQVIGAGMIVLGLLEALAGGLLGGLWLVMLGWFLREAGQAEVAHSRLSPIVEKLTVAEVMSVDPVVVNARTRLDAFVEDRFHGGRHAAYPVLDDASRVVGLLSINSLRLVPRSVWHEQTIAECMTPLEEVPVVEPTSPMTTLLGALEGRSERRALVVDAGRLVGIVAPSDVARLVSLMELAARPLDRT